MQADYVKGMWMMLQTDDAQDYVLATGETHTVREFCVLAFKVAGIDISWEGEGVHEVGSGVINGQKRSLVKISEQYYRPTEVDVLLGDPTKAKKVCMPIL